MSFQLTVISGQDEGREILLSDGETTLGRSTRAKIQLGDLSISRQHCVFLLRGDELTVTDAGSSSGTIVNGSRTTQIVLNAGDELRLGNSILRVNQNLGEQKTVMPAPVQQRASSDKELLDLTGTKIHDYQIERAVGEGKTGVIYQAHDTKKDRTVAVKILKPEVSEDKEGMQRFVRAMKTMFVVRHENLVRIYNVGKTGELTWVAMEYVDGESMAQVIDRIGTAGMLDWEYAFRVAVHGARALEAAANHSIIHRNIRPENILMREADQVVKLGDTMLAKALEGSMARQITRPGQLIGDLAYMSPEQTASAEHADGRSDLYALGATCYALLTGRPPFESRSFPELLEMIRKDTPKSPKVFQLSINDLFSGCVMQLLKKRPEDRYQTPTALLKELDRIAKFANVCI